jgi:hypothetical protein
MPVVVSVISYNCLFLYIALVLQFLSVLWCLVRTIKVFIINSVYRAIIIVAILTLETEVNVFW